MNLRIQKGCNKNEEEENKQANKKLKEGISSKKTIRGSQIKGGNYIYTVSIFKRQKTAK